MQDETNIYLKSVLGQIGSSERLQMLFINKMRCSPKTFANEVLDRFRSRFQELNGETFYITLDSSKAIKAPNGL
jgi:hypothetical protein